MHSIDLLIGRTEAVGAHVALRVNMTRRDAHLAEYVPIIIDIEALHRQSSPEQYAAALTDMIFVPKVFDAWCKAYYRFAAAATPIRLRLHVTGDDALHALHWELLRNPIDGSQLAYSERILFSRLLSNENLEDDPAPERADLRAVVAVANPDALSQSLLAPIDIPLEVARAQASISPLARLITLDGSGDHSRATLTAIASALRDGAQILYVVCHGTLLEDVHPYLWLEHEGEGVYQPTPGEALLDLLGQLAVKPQLVILASCESGGNAYTVLSTLGPRIAALGVGAVLALQGRASQTLVGALLPKLFEELQRDGQIDRALAVARASLPAAEQWWLPRLWMSVRDGALWRDRPVARTRQLLDLLVQAEEVGAGLHDSPSPEDRMAQWEALLRQLTMLPLRPACKYIQEAYTAVSRATTPLPDIAEPGELLAAAFALLEDIPPLGLPAVLEFAANLCHYDATTRPILSDWVARACEIWDASSADLDLRRAQAEEASLLIALVGRHNDYAVHAWIWSATRQFERLHEVSTRYAQEQLGELIAQLYYKAAQKVPNIDRLTVEFFLPRALFTEPVQSWTILDEGLLEDDPPIARALHTLFRTVVVRSTERSFQPPRSPQADQKLSSIRKRWEQKWRVLRALRDEAGTRAYPGGPVATPTCTEDFEQLAATGLAPTAETVCYAETLPPPPQLDRGQLIFRPLIEAGVPAGVWPAAGADRPKGVHQQISRLVAQSLAQLPERLRALDPKFKPSVVLFWDNPERIPAIDTSHRYLQAQQMRAS